MNDRLLLDDYKQQIADLYDRRSDRYDDGEWHPRIASRLVELAQLQPGQQVLDLATGTGMVAIEAAQIVGNQGRAIGIDIAPKMLAQARSKVERLGLSNIEFQLADAEALEFPPNSFDCIFCSSAFIWMSDLIGALQHWYRFLKPGGKIGFHAFAETAFIAGTLAQQVLEKQGVSLLLSKPTGTEAKCRDLLERAGYGDIEMTIDRDGDYISLEKAQSMWLGDGSNPTPGQHPNPLLQLSAAQLDRVKTDFDSALTSLQTDRGIWNDATILYTFGRKMS